MKQEQFELQYQSFWADFEGLLDVLDGGASSKGVSADSDSLDKFSSSYRRLCNHLAIAKKRRYSARVVKRLNFLVLRAHQHLYQRNSSYFYRAMEFVLAEFPCCLRKHARAFWSATALFYVPGLIMFAAVLLSPEMIYTVMSPQQVNDFELMYDPSADRIGRERQSDGDLLMFGYYIYNNIGIAFQTFASGLLLTLGSLFYLVFNGLVIGAVAGHIVSISYEETFFSFVVGHGSFELTAITIAGAAGIKLGVSLLAPNNLSRLESLKLASVDATKLIIGAAIMLLFAAFIEAFWSSMSSVSPAIKYTVGGALWAFIIFYLAASGRGSRFES